jgi:hypothetical protein
MSNIGNYQIVLAIITIVLTFILLILPVIGPSLSVMIGSWTGLMWLFILGKPPTLKELARERLLAQIDSDR